MGIRASWKFEDAVSTVDAGPLDADFLSRARANGGHFVLTPLTLFRAAKEVGALDEERPS
jgi:hypothetical protein